MAGGLTPQWQKRKPLQTNTLEFFFFLFSKISLKPCKIKNKIKIKTL